MAGICERVPIPAGHIRAPEISVILGIGQDRVYALSRQGRLPGEKTGNFYFPDRHGCKHPVPRCWSEAEIRKIAGIPVSELPVVAAPRPEAKPAKPANQGIPAGWLKAYEASKLLGITINTLICQSEAGILPGYRWHQYITANGNTNTVRIWNEKEIRAQIPARKKKSKRVMAGELQALLSRLWSRAEGKIVDGDATDIIFGNPAREKDWGHIEALAKEGCLEWQLDRFDRLEIILNPEWQPDESGSWRCFG